MSKKIGVVVALAGMCALSLFLLSCGSSSSRPSGFLYVLTQGSSGTGNNVSSFSIDLSSGGLSLVNSNASTCVPAGGSCGLPLNIVLDPTGAAAFVLNQGVPCPEVFDQTNGVWICDPTKNSPVAPTIYPYTVSSDGSLSAPGGAVTWACGAVSPCANSDTAVAMVRDAAGQFLFVIDQGSSPSPGTATPPVYPTCPHAPTSATDVCPSISVFAMQAGSLTLASGSPFYLSKIPSALSVITFTPSTPAGASAKELLFVTNNHDICMQGCNPPHNDNTVSVYAVSSDGTLTEQPNSPYAIAAANPISVLAVNTNPAGQNNSGGLFVYVGNNDQNGGDVNPFQVCTVQNAVCSQQQVDENLMVPVTCAQASCITPAGQKPVEMLVDPTNNFLYVVCEGSNQVYGYRINTTVGTLSALNPAYEPTGSQPVALAMHSTGKFLYTSNSNASNISGFTVSTTSGSMSTPITVTSPASPSGMAAR
jgi:hypothetical protein